MREALFRCLMVFLPLLAATGCSLSRLAPFSTSSAKGFAVKEETLANGMKLTVQEDRSIALVTMDMWVKVGSGDEPPEIAGISHYLEHMLFKGTARLNVGDYDRIVEEAGGYLNAATSMDYTHYYVTVPSKHFDMILDHFADVMMNSAIDPTETEMERQVILEEIARKVDNPFGFLFDETIPALFESGPYTHPVIGSVDSVKAITREQLAEHYQRFYAPTNMYLNIVGDVDAATARASVEKAFAGFNRPLRPWRDAPPADVFAAPRTRNLPHDWNEAYFIMAFPAGAAGDSRAMAVQDLAETLLTSGRSSRLVNSLQEKRAIVSSIGSYFMTNRSRAPLLIYGTCKPELVDEVREAILEEVGKVVSEGIGDREWEKVRRQAVNGHLYGLETNAGRASAMGYSQVMLGSPELLTGYSRQLKSVAPEDVRHYLAEYLRDDQASFFVTGKLPRRDEL